MELDRQFPLEDRPLESLLREHLLFARAGIAAQTPAVARARLEDVRDDARLESCARKGDRDETVSPLQVVAQALDPREHSLFSRDRIEVQARHPELPSVREELRVGECFGEGRRERRLGLTGLARHGGLRVGRAPQLVGQRRSAAGGDRLDAVIDVSEECCPTNAPGLLLGRRRKRI